MIITPSVGIVYPGDVGIVLRLSLELFLVHDAPVIRQPFFRRQFIVLFIFPYGVLAKIVVIFIMCLWVLNICYLMVIKLVCPNRFDSVRRQPPGFRRVSVGEIHVQVTKRKPQFLDAFPLPVDAFGGGNAQNAGSGDGIILIQFTRFPVSENVQGIRDHRLYV